MKKQNKLKKNIKLAKPFFKKILIKNLAIFICAAILIAVIGTLWSVSYYDVNEREYCEETLKEYRENIRWKYATICEKKEVKNLATGEVLSEGEKWEQFKVQAEYSVFENAWKWGQKSWGITEVTSNQFVMKSPNEVLYYWIETDNESPEYTYFQCKDEAVLSELRKYASKPEMPVQEYFLQIRGLYVKGFDFIPEKVTVLKDLGINRDHYYDEDGNEVTAEDNWICWESTPFETVEELDFSPEDTSAYTYINTININASHNLSTGIRLYNYGIEETQETLEKGVGIKGPDYFLIGGEIVVEKSGLAGSEKKICVFDEITFGEVEGIGNSDYQMVVAENYNIFEEYGYRLIRIYIIILLLAIVIPCIMSIIQYTRKRSYYEMDQYRRNMTNTMAHDLKSPLMVISGYAENLLEPNSPEKQQHFIHSILGNVQYMNRIIENVLELSKVENGEYKLNKEELNLRELTQDMVANYKSQLEEKGLDIRISGEAVVQADQLWMTQVVDNLISNAAKYAAEGTMVEICMDNTKYEISNVSAVAFDMDVKELVNPFVKGDNSRSGKQGSGIGLTIVKNIVEQHGYLLELECQDNLFVTRIKMNNLKNT